MKHLANISSPESQPETSNVSIVALEDKAGPMQRLFTNVAVSAEAGRGLREIDRERIAGQVKIERTAIVLATTRICAALTARSLPAIGSLAVVLNTATSAVDGSLTSAAAADVAGHLRNRSRNKAVVAELERVGDLNADEAKILNDWLETDLATDAERARHRMALGKEAVSLLHSYGLAGIKSAESTIEKSA